MKYLDVAWEERREGEQGGCWCLIQTTSGCQLSREAARGAQTVRTTPERRIEDMLTGKANT